MEISASETTAGSLLFFLLLLLFVIWVAKRNGFFKLPSSPFAPPVSFLQTSGAFLTYFISAFLFLPLLVVLVVYAFTGDWKGVDKLPALWKGWVQCVGLIVLFLVLVVYALLLRPATRRSIFWGEGEASWSRFFQSAGMGLVGGAVSYPFVLVSSVLTSALAKWIWGESHLEQVAVKQLKLTMDNPPLFACMVVIVVLLVPFMEEFLFRGILQNFLKKYLGRSWAIALTALVFSAVHFAPSQGSGNFQLILSLLALAGFLGFVYERERTLWAPMALHAAFNTVNVIAIALSA